MATYLTFRLASMVLSILQKEKQGLPSVWGLWSPTQHLQLTGPVASPDHRPRRALQGTTLKFSSRLGKGGLGALGGLKPLITR